MVLMSCYVNKLRLNLFWETNREEALVSLDDASISLHAMVGTPNPRTICVYGLINKKHVVILIGTGSTYNFFGHCLSLKL